LWTLQESRQAQEVAFVFLDNVLRVKDRDDLLTQARNNFQLRTARTLDYDRNIIRRGESSTSRLHQLFDRTIEPDKAQDIFTQLQLHCETRPVFHAGNDAIIGALNS
jgi:hypothetical protein